MNSSNKSSSQPASFEGMSGRLQEIVRRLESGNVTLVESVRLYEEGAKLAQKCSLLLDRAQLKIKKIQDELQQINAEIDKPDGGNANVNEPSSF